MNKFRVDSVAVNEKRKDCVYIYVIGNTILRLIIYKCRNIYNIAYVIQSIRNNMDKFRVVVGELEEKIVHIYILIIIIYLII